MNLCNSCKKSCSCTTTFEVSSCPGYIGTDKVFKSGMFYPIDFWVTNKGDNYMYEIVKRNFKDEKYYLVEKINEIYGIDLDGLGSLADIFIKNNRDEIIAIAKKELKNDREKKA